MMEPATRTRQRMVLWTFVATLALTVVVAGLATSGLVAAPPAASDGSEPSAEPVYEVVSPLGERTAEMGEMARRLDTLNGKTVCMVWNYAFKSDVTLPAIGEALKKRYPDIKIVPYREMPLAPLPDVPGSPSREAENLKSALKAMGSDAVIVGNGGCGICTPRASYATIVAEQLGIPAVVVTNPGFDDQARTLGQNAGLPSLQVALYPDPFDLETNAQLLEKTEEILVPQVIDALTRPISASNDSADVKDRREIVFAGTVDQIHRHFTDLAWSDGLSITPPTKARVEEFLKYTDHAPGEEIAVLPPGNLRATPWAIAANGVMAGCRPEHMPVLIAAVQSMGDPAFRYRNHGASTHSFTNFFWINGPLARQLGIDYGQGLIAHPVNTVIGRAMSLIERNIAGLRIKETQMGSFGKTASWVLAEDEAALSQLGWEPYHVEKGFDRNANTLSAGTSTVWGRNLIPATSDPETLMQLIAYGAVNTEALASGFTGQSRRFVLVAPGIAKTLAEGDYSKTSLRRDLMRNGRKITHEAIFSQVHGSFGRVQRSFETELARALRDERTEKAKLPPWYPKFPGWEEIETTPAVGMVEFIVCGDPARNKVQILAGGPGTAIKEIRLPTNWDELMEQAGYRPLRDFVLEEAGDSDEVGEVGAEEREQRPARQ